MPLKNYIKSFSYALKGVSYAFRSQVNLRFHSFAATIAIISSIALHISAIEWCIILLCIGSVISAELINTSLETNVDLVSPGRNEKAGQVKDLAAAGVLVTCIISAIIGGIVFVPKILQLL